MDQKSSELVSMLEKVRSGVADVARARQRVEESMAALAQEQGRREMQAGEARRLGREDLAEVALLQRDVMQMQIAAMKEQYKQLLDQETKLIAAEQALQAKLSALEITLRKASPEVGAQHARKGAELERPDRAKASKRNSPQYIVVKVLTNALSFRAWAQQSESQVLHLARSPMFGMALGSDKVTLCGRPYNRSVGMFRPSEATCGECKRRASLG